METALKEMLTRAQRWGAVMLIDEADVYIKRRDDNIAMNAVVGVFLRVLEYFNGLLFLTTNRVDDIDEAIVSRCIALIKYNPPDDDAKRRIWRVMAEQFALAVDDALIDDLVTVFPKRDGPRHQGPGQADGEVLPSEAGPARPRRVPALRDLPRPGCRARRRVEDSGGVTTAKCRGRRRASSPLGTLLTKSEPEGSRSRVREIWTASLQARITPERKRSIETAGPTAAELRVDILRAGAQPAVGAGRGIGVGRRRAGLEGLEDRARAASSAAPNADRPRSA